MARSPSTTSRSRARSRTCCIRNQSNNPVVKKFKTPMDKYAKPEEGYNIVCTTYRLTEHYHYWTKNNPMNVQLVPEPFVEIPAELADEMGITGGEKVKVSSIRADYIAKAMVTRRIKPMMIDGKKMYQIGMPIHWGYRGISERRRQDGADAGESADADGDRSERVHAGVQGIPGEAGEGLKALSFSAGTRADGRKTMQTAESGQR